MQPRIYTKDSLTLGGVAPVMTIATQAGLIIPFAGVFSFEFLITSHNRVTMIVTSEIPLTEFPNPRPALEPVAGPLFIAER